MKMFPKYPWTSFSLGWFTQIIKTVLYLFCMFSNKVYSCFSRGWTISIPCSAESLKAWKWCRISAMRRLTQKLTSPTTTLPSSASLLNKCKPEFSCKYIYFIHCNVFEIILADLWTKWVYCYWSLSRVWNEKLADFLDTIDKSVFVL